MSIGLDTSVVLRLLVGVPEAMMQAAARRLRAAHASGERVVVSDLVAAEVFHALRHHYGMPEPESRDLMLRFLQSGTVELEPAAALSVFEPAAGAGLIDRLIHARYGTLGAGLLSVDREQSRLEGAELLA